MGKIKVRTLGDETLEIKQKNKAKQKAEQKKFVKGAKGGERVVSVGPSEEELAQLEVAKEPKVEATPSASSGQAKKKSQRKKKVRIRSKSYKAVAQLVDRSKRYNLSDALSLLEKLKRAKLTKQSNSTSIPQKAEFLRLLPFPMEPESKFGSPLRMKK